MNIPERSEKELLAHLQQEAGNDPEAVYFHTPLCGTCALAERMLGIVLETGAAMPVSKININFAPVLRETWRISSVPCLVILENGRPVRIEYALHSVVDLHRWLKR
ncbi:MULTISPECIES: thioredoxin family protein [Paenibacillus]|uniref:thioredoxin family protein n=1 Tax=Paenibacillus TaxID=44249 RepID=UPI002FE33CAB